MENKIGIGIIGAGTISNFHARGYLKDERAEIVAVCDVVKEKAVEKAERWGVPKWYTDSNKLLKDKDIDAVDICLPPDFHAPVAIAAAEAGKHVFVEKPMALTLKDCDEMIESAKFSNVKLMVGHNQLFFHPHNEAKQLIETEIGRPIVLVTRLHNGLPVGGWRTDPKISGGFLMESCVHRFYLSRYLMGEIKRVSCLIGKTRPEFLTEDMAVVSMEFKNGSFGSISANSGGTYPLWDDRTEIIGSEGLVVINGVEDQIWPGPPLLFYKNGQWKVYCKRKISEEMREMFGETADEISLTSNEIDADFAKTFSTEVRHFVDCVVNNKTPMVSGEEGKRTVQVILACYESAEKGKAVYV